MTTARVSQNQTIRPKQTSNSIRLGYILLWVAVILVTAFALFPFLWAVLNSFKTQREALQGTWIPFVQFQPTLDNWRAELGLGGRETFKALRNSAMISIGAMLIATTLGTVTGYGLARFRFRIGNRNLVSWFLSQRFLPPVATLIPFFLMLQRLNMLDTIQGMVIVNATFTLPFAVLIMRDFFADFPREIEEAALVDGANHWQVFWRVALPLAGPALAAAAIICFAFAWNEFLFASVMTTRNAQPFTLLVASTGTVRGIHFGFVGTRMLIAVLLPVILSLFVQRYVIRGLTLGAVKG
ncbi:MAG: carbohydrate ABC transporter permease [Chloroflexi bacterium]|nr:MAG: carbohydrate ABC transporter permease [Chloroflexota bacterium]